MKTLPVVLLLLASACGPGEPDPELAGTGADGPAPAEAAPVAAKTPADSDPCALVPVAEWEAATGYTDVRADRSSADVCDFLSDDLWGVVGSVGLHDRAFLDYVVRRADDPTPLSGLGDQAVALPLGVVFRVGERVVFVMVNPSVEGQPEIARAIARLAFDNL
jgi:hypothetical protein